MNNNIIEEFIKYSKYLKNKLEENNDSKVLFRYKSTIRTITILKKNKNLIDNLDLLIKLKGIGKGTIDKIKEINEHGCIKEISNFVVEINPVDTLVKVIGIGPKKAKQLINSQTQSKNNEKTKPNNKTEDSVKENVDEDYRDEKEKLENEEIIEIF